MLFELLRRSAQRDGKAAALIEEDGTVTTYADLCDGVEAFAAALSDAGVTRGAYVAVLLPNTVEFVIATFAIARVGAVLVPLNPAFRVAELRYYFRECGATAVITDRDHSHLAEELHQALPGQLRIITEVRGIGLSVADDCEPVSLSEPALCQYSSGSTGRPKAIVRTHAQLCAEAEHFVRTVNVTSSDRILTVVPLFHAHGFGNCLLAAVYAGAALILRRAFHRRSTVAALVEQRVSIFPGVPFMFGILASSASIPAQALPALRLAFSAGASLPHQVFTAFREKFSTEVRQLYGSTETGSVSINLGGCEGDRWASVGEPMASCEIRVVDPWGAALADGERGEILVRSAAMTTGYRGLEAESAAAFRDGWYWTSDLGYRDPQGSLYLTGRTTIFINTGGHKVDPLEVEAVLDRHPKIARSVVVGAKGRYGRQLVKAVIVANEPCAAEEVVAWCREQLAEFKVPRLVEFRREIPVSPLGKVLRKYLQDFE